MDFQESSEDQNLMDLFNELKEDTPRNLKVAGERRDQYLSTIIQPVSISLLSRLIDILKNFFSNKSRTFAVSFSLLLIFTLGTTATAYASQNVGINDPLYGAKIFFENVQTILVVNQDEILEWHIRLARLRSEEISQTKEFENNRNLEIAIANYYLHLAKANEFANEPDTEQMSEENSDLLFSLNNDDSGIDDIELEATSQSGDDENITTPAPTDEQINPTEDIDDDDDEESSNHTEEPDETNQPDETNEPDETETPGGTDEPEETSTPDETEEPEGTETPDETDEPGETEDPDETDTPEPTRTPKPTDTSGTDEPDEPDD